MSNIDSVRSVNTFLIYGLSFLKAARLFRFAKRTPWQLVTMKRHARNADMNLRATSCTEE